MVRRPERLFARNYLGMTGPTHRPSVTAPGAASRRWLGPLPWGCQGWTPCLPAARCLRAAVGGSSGPVGPWGGAAQARLPGCAGCIATGPSARSSLGASPSSLDAPTSIPSGWTFAARKRQPGSRASLGAGGFAPQHLSGRWGGPALSRRGALRAALRAGCRRRCSAPRCRLPPAPGRGPGGLAGACPQPRFAAPSTLTGTCRSHLEYHDRFMVSKAALSYRCNRGWNEIQSAGCPQTRS